MNDEIRQRLRWVKLYQKTGNQALVCLRCGISRPTLRKWLTRYDQNGEAALVSESRRPHRSPQTKIHAQQNEWIAQLRKRRLGSRRIQTELKRLYDCDLARSTIQKFLTQHFPEPLHKSRLARKKRHRYSKEIPGERVQLDTCQIAPGLYQYTAIDDCTRIRVLGLYTRRTAQNSLLFLEKLIVEMPFPIQRIQTDRGREFFAYCFQERLMSYGIKFRPNKPASPHLNGKVERSQRTDLEEFYPSVDLRSPDLEQLLEQWQDYYNQERIHGSLGGITPWEKWDQLAKYTPIFEEVEALFDPAQERIRYQDYRLDLEIAKVKRCL